MSGRGVHLSFDPADEGRLLAASTLIEGLELARDRQPSDRAWEPIHRCLTDGTLAPSAGTYPLDRLVLGGRRLPGQEARFVPAAEVRDLAAALAPIDEAWLRSRYQTLAGTDYAEPLGDVDFLHTWEWFRQLRAFVGRTAAAGRSMVFTVDRGGES